MSAFIILLAACALIAIAIICIIAYHYYEKAKSEITRRKKVEARFKRIKDVDAELRRLSAITGSQRKDQQELEGRLRLLRQKYDDVKAEDVVIDALKSKRHALNMQCSFIEEKIAELSLVFAARENEMAARHKILGEQSDLVSSLETLIENTTSKYKSISETDNILSAMEEERDRRASELKNLATDIQQQDAVRLRMHEEITSRIPSLATRGDLLFELIAHIKECEHKIAALTNEISALDLSYQIKEQGIKDKIISLQKRMEAEAAASIEDVRSSYSEHKRLLVSDEAAIRFRHKEINATSDLLTQIKSALKIKQTDLKRIENEVTLKKIVHDTLQKKASEFEEVIALSDMGVYKPHYDFSDSRAYKVAIDNIRSKQKSMLLRKDAVVCREDWTLNGSASQGRTMIERAIKLTVRAFNGEVDTAISNTRWNNVATMENRIRRAREQIDKLNASYSISIRDEYVQLKISELYLVHEHKEKAKEEKEIQAEERRAAREEERLLRDLEVAEEHESRIKRSIDKARKEIESGQNRASTDSKYEALNERIRLLEKDLQDAHTKVERAQALAEKTKSGYVYIISNIGSFGKDIVKIGMTRRLDPMDRVRELGDASVPFVFDTHAMIYSDDAPALERSLHIEFETTRVNTENFRKEFFRVSIPEVEAAVKRLAPSADFYPDIEAQEFHESLARRQTSLIKTSLISIGVQSGALQ